MMFPQVHSNRSGSTYCSPPASDDENIFVWKKYKKKTLSTKPDTDKNNCSESTACRISTTNKETIFEKN